MSPAADFGNRGVMDFAPGSVFGLRWWALDPEPTGEPTLHGMYGPWNPGENVAKCRHDLPVHPGQPAPAESCSCGLFAYWTPHPSPLSALRPVHVMGVIEGYGRALIGDKGFRAEKARIRGLSISPDPSGPYRLRDFVPEEIILRLQNALEDRYRVPVYSSQALLLREHPPTTDYLPDPGSWESEEGTGTVTWTGSGGSITFNGTTLDVRSPGFSVTDTHVSSHTLSTFQGKWVNLP